MGDEAKMKPATALRKYEPKEWILKEGWLFDRSKYLMMLEETSYDLYTNYYYSFERERDNLRFAFPQIYSKAWEEFFREGFSKYDGFR